MGPVEIKPDIYWIGVNDRKTDLFEGLWPIEQVGVSYNSYLILDEKKAIIDLSKEIMTDELLEQIGQVADISQLDYVIINHMEPDHSGALRRLRELAPQVTLVGSARTEKMLKAFYGITDGVQVVKDGDTLSLGRHTLKFISTPRVHWPETMMTYEPSGQILFSCDAFGSYGLLTDTIFDDQCSDLAYYEREALRYYTNILAAFGKPVLNAFDKLAKVPVSIVAPSHGLVWRGNPEHILNLYKQWATYSIQPSEPGVTIIYGSMYGNTGRIVEAVARGIAEESVPFDMYDAARTHVSYILPSLWTKRGVLIGAPTYERSLFPPVNQVLKMAELKEIFHKQTAYVGSYAWGGGAQKVFENAVESLQWKVIDSLVFAGGPSPEDLKRAEDLGRAFARSVKAA
jgi:anaerobic nitric oxide reductase flavorubredoxin